MTTEGCDPPGPGQINRSDGAHTSGDFVQARDVSGGVHFHHQGPAFVVTPRQLPGDVRGFVDRRVELATLTAFAAGERAGEEVVAVITGTAGVGKTSLALHWAHGVRADFPDGQLYVNLRGYDPGLPATPEQVLSQFLTDLGVPIASIPSGVEASSSLYRSLLATRRLLVILDNAASTKQVRPLLPGTTRSLVIVTSRSDLPGLGRRDGAFRVSLDILAEDDAVALLSGVTAAYRRDDTPSELTELARLCARLPLALRIAAERAASRPMMLLDELIADLRDESGLWDALSADPDEENDAVRTVFAWSYRALSEPVARLFRLLGLHPGNEFGLPAIAALSGYAASDVRHHLDILVGAHLLEQYRPGRYEFHDLLRAYAVDQVRHLESPGTRTQVLKRVIRWYSHSADAASITMAPFDRFVLSAPAPSDVTPLEFDSNDAAFAWFTRERSNLAQAVATAFRTGSPELAWQLAAVLGGLYMHQDAGDEWLGTARIGLAAAISQDDLPGQAQSQENMGRACLQAGQLDEAETHQRAALTLRRDIGDRAGEGVALNALGLTHLRRRHLAQAQSLFTEGATVFTGLRDQRWQAILQGNLAQALIEASQLAPAIDSLQTALATFTQLEDHAGEGNALFLLAWAHRELGDLARARGYVDRALEVAEGEVNQVWRAHWLVELGRIQLADGHADDALVSFQESASLQRQLSDPSREAFALHGTGEAYLQLGRSTEAAQFLRAAADTHRALKDRWSASVALIDLATAVDQEGDPVVARSHREQAHGLLTEFSDPRARALAHQLSRDLGAS